MRDHEGVENLLQAFVTRDYQRLAALAAAGADINAWDEDGLTVLMRASPLGDASLVAAILEAGADVDARSQTLPKQPEATSGGVVTLSPDQDPEALRAGIEAFASALVEGISAAQVKHPVGQTALMFAAESGHLETVESLLAAGADPQIEDRDGGTALIGAAGAGHADVVGRLLDAADVDADTRMSMGGGAGARPAGEGLLGGALREALRGGHEEAVALLLERHAGEEIDKGLPDAIERAHIGIARRLIAAGADLTRQDRRHGTPLLHAVEKGQSELVRHLIAAGADVNLRKVPGDLGLFTPRDAGRTPLMAAAGLGQAETVRDLLAAGAEIDARIDTAATFPDAAEVLERRRKEGGSAFQLQDEGATALMLAARNGQVEVVRQLVAAGAGLDLRDAQGQSAVALAIRAGHAEIADLLKASGASQEGLTGASLLAAVKRGDADEVAALLAAGGVDPDVGEKDEKRGTRPALVLAAELGHGEIVRALLAAGAAADARVAEGPPPWDRTALMLAAEQGHLDPVRALLAGGADPEARDRDFDRGGTTALMLAAEHGQTQVLEALKDAGVRLDARSKEGMTALAHAAGAGRLEAVRRLITWGADVGIGRQEALVRAAGEGHRLVVGTLIAAGADVGVFPRDGWSALTAAIHGGHEDTARFLLRAGADATEEGAETTPLAIAIAEHSQALVEVLLAAGADVNAAGADGMTPLMQAVIYHQDRTGKSAFVETLLGRGADPNRADEEGMTALIYAADHGKVEVVRSLLAAGAELDAGDGQGRTALSCAIDSRNSAVVELLEGLGAAKGKSLFESGDEGEDEDEDEDEELSMTQQRGVVSFDGNDMMALVKAPVGEAAAAFKQHCGAEIWQQDVYGQEVEYTNRCYIVFRFRGHPWTVIRDQFIHLMDGRYVGKDDAQAVSAALGVPAIYFANSDTAGSLSYRYYESGRQLEWLEAGEDFGEEFGEGDEDELDEEALVRFGSELREVDPAEIDPFDFVDAFLRGHDAFVPSWGGGWGAKAGEKHRLEIGGIEPEDFERMDFVAVR